MTIHVEVYDVPHSSSVYILIATVYICVECQYTAHGALKATSA